MQELSGPQYRKAPHGTAALIKRLLQSLHLEELDQGVVPLALSLKPSPPAQTAAGLLALSPH